jgi:GTP-binding protein HflX
VEAKDMLFATLDPTLRQLPLPGGRPAILSDTVGFISDLPHELVEAFRATLEEVREADVILHVRDIAGADSEAQSEDVAKVLAEIGIGEDRRIVEVWNKIDQLSGEALEQVRERAGHAGAVAVSAVTGDGVGALLTRIADLVDEGPDMVFELTPADGEGVAWLYRHGRVSAREDTGEAVVITARLDSQALGRFEQMRPLAHLRPAAE